MTRKQCSDEPIYAPGYDLGPITQHDFDAIFANPNLFELNALTTEEREITLDRGWYDSYNNTAGACGFPRQQTSTGTSYACDEYPFYRTQEAGPVGGLLRPKQLLETEPTYSSREGNRLNGFYIVCGLDTEADPDRQFLVVPLPQQSAIPTTAIC